MEGRVILMRLIGGTRLSLGETAIRGAGSFSGTLAATGRKANGDSDNGFLTREPVDLAYAGRYAILTFPDGQTAGYRIMHIVPHGTGARLVTEADPGFDLERDGTVRERCYPYRTWSGGVEIGIDNIEEMRF